MAKRVLFILKRNEGYSQGKRSGLLNSTRFVADGIASATIETSVVEVQDNNDIDREVTRYKPDLVIIEALWVVPEKFRVLKRLHPRVEWAVHIHSNVPFLALEGIAVEWLKGYSDLGVKVIINSAQAYEGVSLVVPPKNLRLLRNVYLRKPQRAASSWGMPGVLNVGCFGAVRPMKNQLTQALAAVKYAKSKGVWLRFHVNATRSETGGDPVLKNLRALFADRSLGELMEVPWLEHSDFLIYLAKNIDIGLQVSLSETFNIVTADYVSQGIPVVTSDEVDWVTWPCWARTGSVDDIARCMSVVSWLRWPLVGLNQRSLDSYSKRSIAEWRAFVDSVGV